MKNLFNKITKIYSAHKEVILYLIFGVLTTLVNLIVKNALLFTVLEASNAFELQVAVVISWIIAVLFAYFTNRKFVFESTKSNKSKEFISFVIARVTTLLLEMLIMWFFITLLKLDSDFYVLIITVVSQGLVIVGNYILSKIFVFKKTDK